MIIASFGRVVNIKWNQRMCVYRMLAQVPQSAGELKALKPTTNSVVSNFRPPRHYITFEV